MTAPLVCNSQSKGKVLKKVSLREREEFFCVGLGHSHSLHSLDLPSFSLSISFFHSPYLSLSFILPLYLFLSFSLSISFFHSPSLSLSFILILPLFLLVERNVLVARRSVQAQWQTVHSSSGQPPPLLPWQQQGHLQRWKPFISNNNNNNNNNSSKSPNARRGRTRNEDCCFPQATKRPTATDQR